MKGEFTREDVLKIGKDSNFDWYIVAYPDESYDIMHRSQLSAILDCGYSPKKYGMKYVCQCGESLDDNYIDYAELKYSDLDEE